MNSHRFISPFYLLLPALLVLLPACKKNWFTRTTEVKVWVVEKGNKVPVEGAEVVLLEGSPGGFLGMPAWSIRERCTTNVLGYCYFKFEPNDDDGYVAYEVKAEHPNYYGPALSDIEVGQRNKKKLVLQPEAWLKVYVKNVNKEYNRFFLDDYGTPSGGGGIFYGLDVDIFTEARLDGNHTKKLMYAYYNSGESYDEWKKFEIDIYCPAHDTTEYTIEY